MPIPKFAITAALMVAQMGMNAMRKIEGPRLDDLGFTGGDYGAPLPRVWGGRRLQCPVIWAEPLREVKRRRKTKGGKYNDYSYYGTWAVALARHQIEAVRRIWLDTHLALDLSGTGPVTVFDFGGSGDFSDYVAIYLGTEDQEPDPRIQATIEAEFGEGSCPAYRGTSYIVFKDVPLEKLGNRIPQVAAEILGVADEVFPAEHVVGEVVGGDDTRLFSPDFATFVVQGFGAVHSVYDVAARAEIATFDTSWDGTPRVRNNGNLLVIDESRLIEADLAGNEVLEVFDFGGGNNPSALWLVADGNGDEHWFAAPEFAGGDGWFDGALIDLDALTGQTCWPNGLFADRDGNVWVVGKENAATTELVFQRLVTVASDAPETVVVAGLASYAGNDFGAAMHYRGGAIDAFVFQWGNDLYSADRLTGAIVDSNATLVAAGALEMALRNAPPLASTLWVGREEIDLADLSSLRTLDLSDWDGALTGASTGFYDPVNHALWSSDGADYIVCYLDRVGAGTVTLGGIIADVCELAGIDPAEFDTSDCTQPVNGYSVGKGSGKDWLEPLLEIYDVDARPHDFELEFVTRGGAAGAAIAYGTFAQPREDAPLYETPGAGGSDLPAMVTMQFADIDADQQPAIASSGPLGAIDSERQLKLELGTLVLDTDDGRQLTARWHRRQWFERQPYGLSLSMQLIALEPGDVRTLTLPEGRQVRARLTSAVLGADRAIVTEWRPDDATLAALDGAAGATFDGRIEQSIPVPLLSKGFVLDVPLLADVDSESTPILYTAAAPFAAGTWPGAVVYEGIDGEYSDEFAAVPSSEMATWGYVEEALPAANPNLWDRGNELTVNLRVGELTGCTEAAVNANPVLNLAAIGAPGRWEIVQFMVATLVAPGQYTVSGFKRGRRGSEWAGELHVAGDQFLLLDTAATQDRGLSDVGGDLVFKAITSGRTEAGAPEIPVEPFTGASLKPYAPCHVEAVKDPVTGDWTVTWVRRTRVGGAWTSGTPIPLSEASEEYEITIGDGVSSDIKTVATPTYTWDVATQTADTGAEVMAGDLAVTVAQISDAVGRGYEAELAA